MKRFMSLLVSTLFLISTGFASANDIATATAANAVGSDREVLFDQALDDLMSPEEIASELPPAFRAARYSDRLHIWVDKSYQGSTSSAQTMRVTLDGRLLHVWKVSTGRERWETARSGKHYFTRTPRGSFRIQRMIRHYWSNTWEAPMPYAIFFNGGIAIHAAGDASIGDLGTRASGGCVRLHPNQAAALWSLVGQIGVANVRITVVGG